MLVIQVLMHGYLLATRQLPSSCRGPRVKNRGRSVSRTSTLETPWRTPVRIPPGTLAPTRFAQSLQQLVQAAQLFGGARKGGGCGISQDFHRALGPAGGPGDASAPTRGAGPPNTRASGPSSVSSMAIRPQSRRLRA